MHHSDVTVSRSIALDTAGLRKARGAFFTPAAISRFIVEWAVRDSHDSVLEPSAGDAAFLVEAVRRMRKLADGETMTPKVRGVEIHAPSARVARARVREAGGGATITGGDFFLLEPTASYSAVIGNPPYIRYQEFSGESRARSRAAALKAGVSLTGLASSWAAFTVHSAPFLKKGGSRSRPRLPSTGSTSSAPASPRVSSMPPASSGYKNLAKVERDFRSIKVDDLDLRPVFHRLED